MPPTVETIDEYICLAPAESQGRLNELRTLIRDFSPESVESITYAIPTYKVDNKRFIYFAGYTKHVSLHPIPKSGSDEFNTELVKYQTGKGTVSFANDKPLPVDFIKQYIKYRYEDCLKGE